MVMSFLLMCLMSGILLVLGDTGGSTYYIGTGRYDITGPATQIVFMGYANPDQVGDGIHLRQYSRAFVFADEQLNSRVVFVSADICMGSTILKIKVVEKLQSLYGNLYSHDNVLISGTHTHGGPAGYLQYVLFQVTSLGFVEQTFNAVVNGIVESIRLAHESMKRGKLSYGSNLLFNANINRSPTAYLQNPAEERARFAEMGDTDKTNLVLKLSDMEGNGIGLVDWFAVHPTSMQTTNTLISSDNKGLASIMMEKEINGESTLPGKGDFVAAFANSNEGDVSPNINGARCVDTGEECDMITSTCNGRVQMCIAEGPGDDMFESTKIIATRQFEAARDVYNTGEMTDISGQVKFVYKNVDFSNVAVTLSNGKNVTTCPAALGRSFGAGTTDGPGLFDFTQGDTGDNLFWDTVRNILRTPTTEQIACHAPKPILIDSGGLNFPYPWHPNIMPLQILQIGQFIIVGVPAEFTTMAGRRTREAVLLALEQNGFPTNSAKVVIAGLSNTYSHYVTTFEEYQAQRYEGASTIFGPHTLEAYIQELTDMAASLILNKNVDPGPALPSFLDQQLSFQPPIVFDAVPPFRRFGSVRSSALSTYKLGETVTVVFRSGNPRNCLMTEKTFLTVEHRDSSGVWKILFTDASWETKFRWKQTNVLLGHSTVTVTWDIPTNAPIGTYRIQHFGCYKPLLADPVPYSGTSRDFEVTH